MAKSARENLDRLIELVLNDIDDSLRREGNSQHGDFQQMKANLNSADPEPSRVDFNMNIHSHYGNTKPLWVVTSSWRDYFKGPPEPAPIGTFKFEFIANVDQDGKGAVSLEFSESVRKGGNGYGVALSLRFALEKLNVFSPRIHTDRKANGMSPIFINCFQTKLDQAVCQCLICAARRYAMAPWGIDV